MNEQDNVMCQVRDSFAGLRMEVPVGDVFARSRARRRRRLARRTATGAATAGAAVALSLSLGGGQPATHIGTAHAGTPTRPSPGSATLAAFSVTSGPGDSTTMVLHKGQQLDASALREALAQHGIPALVTVGTVCRSTPPASIPSGLLRSPSGQTDGSDVMMILGSELPPGTELSIGYGESWIKLGVITDGAPLTCGLPFGKPAVHITAPTTAVRGKG